MLRASALLFVLFLAVANVSAQPAEGLKDPDCEQDPGQAGCDPSCTEGCDHPPCPTDLAGNSPQSGGVFMSWTLNSFSDVKVYRAEGDGPFEEIAYKEFPTTRFIDLDADDGVTYRYQVTAVGMHQYNETVPAEGESPACETIEATTVPVFPHVWAGVGATLLGACAYLVSRRRT